MPILNYTTEIEAYKTVGEIQQILARAGAITINVDYANGEPIALVFVIPVQDTFINFRLPSRHEGVLIKLMKDPDVPRRFRTETQARRISWRIIKNWVEAQVAIIQVGQAELAEVFLPYAVMPTGRTLFQEYTSGGNLLMPGDQ